MGDVIKSVSGTYITIASSDPICVSPHSHLPESGVASPILELRAIERTNNLVVQRVDPTGMPQRPGEKVK